MATINDWLEGARVRTLPASVSPVLVGTGVAVMHDGASWVRALLAAGVALLLQIGVNFANDYSDGVRGTDEFRTGPPRLTGGGKASPQVVKAAAFASFALAGLVGLILVALTGQWWLIAVGAAAVIAAWFYTGGTRPYGYMGLGEVFVIIFFGYVATVGTTYTQTGTAPWEAWVGGTGVGLIACALLMVNNIRDIPTDSLSGKNTLAVRLGDRRARLAYGLMLAAATACGLTLGITHWPIAAGMVAIGLWAGLLSARVRSGLTGRDLIGVLRDTGLLELGFGVVVLLASFTA
ncbi:1,4-dihydroxy-2-naphthoate polyprenyltransferase [Trueperella bialowiezensis]|uniref:1,4-dihydroxy-2-naphthoate octaprenyltransferase n=1 Tax=Trueperella bialowiezensis TaxID=312285 RepID=A0A3S4YYN0_9ACTO|nr:1,4-dihydroxy-2-naphthoate polyprenyltransferase [Trueperella bialowiezensis]VEI13688.1 1,4-dihydroxy-2-naphthoate octaprenyltransferase [Trueperella bialowiezensis]